MSPTPTPYVEAWLPGHDGLQFYTRTYPATFPKAVVLFVHGFAEHVGRYEHAHVQYPARSITVFAFDVRGYGRTALDTAHRSKEAAYGKTSWDWQLRDIEFWGQHLAKEYPNVPLYLMGHSAVRAWLWPVPRCVVRLTRACSRAAASPSRSSPARPPRPSPKA